MPAGQEALAGAEIADLISSAIRDVRDYPQPGIVFKDLTPVLADAIVEVTETGSSLRANRLRIIDTVMESETHLIANRTAYGDPWKKEKIDNISLMLNGAIAAQGRVGLMMNVEKKHLDQVLAMLPALDSPTISALSESGWAAVNTVLEESVLRDVIPKLKSSGATGIVEYPLNKIVF